MQEVMRAIDMLVSGVWDRIIDCRPINEDNISHLCNIRVF